MSFSYVLAYGAQKRIKSLRLTPNISFAQHDIIVKAGVVFPGWTFVTRGLFALGSKELVMTVKCKSSEVAEAFKTGGRSFPESILHLFANIYEDHFANAVDGHLDEAMWYEWPQFDGDEPQHFLGDSQWVAFVFGPPDYLGYADLEGLFAGNQPYMSIQSILADEFELAKRFGVTRLMALMGQHLQAYPWPRFIDRERSSAIPAGIDVTKAREENKVFEAGEQVVLSELCAVLDLKSKTVSLRIPQHQLILIKAHFDALPTNSGVIFNLTFAPHADSHLYWNPLASSSPSEYHFIKKINASPEEEPKVELLGGSFLAIVPRGASDFITVHEDGFVAMISNLSWTVLRQCLSDGLDCKIKSDLPQGLTLDLTFADDDLPEEEAAPESISQATSSS